MSDRTQDAEKQADFLTIYRGRHSRLHHMAYMRMAKVLLALDLCERAGVELENKSIFDYGFGAGTFFRHCPKSSRLFGVEMDSENVSEVCDMLKERGFRNLDLHTIDIQHWAEHPLLRGSYDVILCSHVLEHLTDPVDFLNRIRLCLTSTGVFLGVVPINERKLDPHHVQTVDRNKISKWAALANLHVDTYIEADPWLYWVQPLFAKPNKTAHKFAQAISLCLGVAATSLRHRWWGRLGSGFGYLTRSMPTQAAFVLRTCQFAT